MSVLPVCVGLFLVTLGVYAGVAGHEFLNWDDQLYVTDNAHVRRGLTQAGIVWALTTSHGGNWHPLTWLSHMLDVELFGVSAGAHHVINAALHALNGALLFVVVRRMTGVVWPAAFVAALFALHPLRVESVAWVAERKDVLAGLFWILALLAYTRYVQHPTRGRYAAVLAALGVGLVAKPMAVTLPFVLLLLDAWPLQRTRAHTLRALVVEKLPMIVVVAAMSVVALLAQSAGGTVSPVESISIGARLANALLAYVAYAFAMVWPSGLAFFYPHPTIADPGFSLASPAALGCGALLAVVTLAVLRLRARAPYLAVGWLWYLVTALPVIGIVQIGTQARADRYTYIPLIGLAIMIAWAGYDVARRRPPLRPVLGVAAGLLLLLLAGLTWRQVATWRGNEALCLHALGTTVDNFVAHTNLGSEYGERGDLAAAAEHLEAAVRINPDFAAAHCNLGVLRYRQASLADARAHLERAIELAPRQAAPLVSLGLIEAREGNPERSAELLERARDIDPTNVAAWFNLGLLAVQRKAPGVARAHFQRALDLDPAHAEAARWLARLRD